MFYIPCPVGSEIRLDILAESAGQRMININQVFTSAVGYVEGIACRLVRCKTSLEIASITFSIYVKSLDCIPSPLIVGVSLFMSILINFGITAA